MLSSELGEVPCTVRGKLRLSGSRATSPVVVGDNVLCRMGPAGSGQILSIEPRRNYIIRKASNLSKESHVIAANLDLALAVVTLADPVTSREFLDRFLVTCQAYRVPAMIVMSKCDLIDPEAVEEFSRDYAAAGYRTVATSTVTGEGMDELMDLTRGALALLAGNSGVGKSSIVDRLCPDSGARVGAISDAHHRGRHTTTYYRVYPLSNGGRIVDTPGIKGFGLIDIENGELWHYFPEMMRLSQGCRFYNCTHTHEPGCAVISAVASGEIPMSRYESYLRILDDDGKYR